MHDSPLQAAHRRDQVSRAVPVFEHTRVFYMSPRFVSGYRVGGGLSTVPSNIMCHDPNQRARFMHWGPARGSTQSEKAAVGPA